MNLRIGSHSVAVLFVVLALVSAGLAGVATSAPEDYRISLGKSVDVPDRSVTIEGTSYQVSAFARFSPGDQIKARVAAPANQEYQVSLYNWKVQLEDSVTKTRSGLARLETDGAPAGTYFVAVVEDGDIQKIFPLVIEGYSLSATADSSVKRGTPVEVSLSVSPTVNQGDAVQVVVANDSREVIVDATRVEGNQYEAEVSTTSLSPGSYAVYGVVRGEETFNDEEIALATTNRQRLQITRQSSDASTQKGAPGSGGLDALDANSVAATPTGDAPVTPRPATALGETTPIADDEAGSFGILALLTGVALVAVMVPRRR